MQSHFWVEVQRTERATVVTVSGELDLDTSTELEEALEQVESTDPEYVILDLSAVDFMDSAGLAVVVRAHQRAEHAGRPFGVVNGSRQVRRLLSLTGMDERMAVVHRAEELLGGG